MKLYLNVPYNEKDEVKALGARWNNKVKKWYIDVPHEEYLRFSKWILKDTDDAIIATEYIYIIEGKRKCWKCGLHTTVIGLGICEHIHIYEEDNIPKYDFNEDTGGVVWDDDEIHLAGLPEEDEIPPKLLKYLKQNYPVSQCYSKTVNDTYFANYCQHCGALQGNQSL